MRNRNGVQSAKPVDQGDRGVIDQRDAIPQDIPLRCAKEQSALADRELRLRADPDEPRLVLAESVVVRNPEPLERCPRLALGWNVLAFVFADGALNRRNVTRRILCAAGTADECRHGLPRLTLRRQCADRFACAREAHVDIMLCRLEGDDEIALPFDALNYRVFAFASIAKGPNVSFGSKASFYSPAYSFSR